MDDLDSVDWSSDSLGGDTACAEDVDDFGSEADYFIAVVCYCVVVSEDDEDSAVEGASGVIYVASLYVDSEVGAGDNSGDIGVYFGGERSS